MKKTTLLTLLIAVVYVLHQDFWNWKKIEPLVLGFLPIGLAYHVGYSLVAALTMLVLVKFVRPPVGAARIFRPRRVVSATRT